MRTFGLGLFAAALVACGGARAVHAPPTSARSEPANPIDRIVVPALAALKVPVMRATPAELCRRLAIDVLGRAPTRREAEECSTKNLETTVDAWMATPESDRVERRAWAELVQYDVATTWYAYVVDADELAGMLSKGTLRYDEFATRLVIHPAFYSRHPDDDWTRQIFAVFLGRTARQDEVRAMRPLVGVWTGRAFLDRKIKVPAGGYERSSREVAFDFCACSTAPLGCASRALGAMVDLGPGCATPPYAKSAATPLGAVRNLALGPDEDPLPHASAEQEDRLSSIGSALAARPDFWEAAVDREMRRYLGWWQTAFKRYESDLPEVRRALASDLARHKSLRALRRTILTSVLYTMPSGERKDVPASAANVRWTSGPRKLLAGEPWLDSMALAIGETLGACDHRFRLPAYLEGSDEETDSAEPVAEQIYADPALVHETKASLIDRRTRMPFDYARAARRLGGCGSGGPPTASSLGLAQAERELAAVLCASAKDIVPGAGSIDDDARGLIERMLGRNGSAEEAKRLGDDMRACMKDKSCADRRVAVRWACTRLATSAEFGTY